MSRSARKSRVRSLPSRPNRTPQSGKTIRCSTSNPSHIESYWPMPRRCLASRVTRPATLIETYRARLKQIDEAKATADYAQNNYERQQHLFDTGAAPRATLDAAIRDLQTAKANLASLQRAAAALAQLGGNPDMPVDQQASVNKGRA